MTTPTITLTRLVTRARQYRLAASITGCTGGLLLVALIPCSAIIMALYTTQRPTEIAVIFIISLMTLSIVLLATAGIATWRRLVVEERMEAHPDFTAQIDPSTRAFVDAVLAIHTTRPPCTTEPKA